MAQAIEYAADNNLCPPLKEHGVLQVSVHTYTDTNRHENEAFRKRSSNWRNLSDAGFPFSFSTESLKTDLFDN